MRFPSGVYFDEGQGLRNYDSRLKRLTDNPRFILINNYKCGYSSSNLLSFDMVTEISREDEVIFFYISIFLRTISVFINWTITDDRYVHQEGWLLANLKDELGGTSYQNFLDLLHVKRHPDAFRLYIESLPAIAARNGHTLPQAAVLEYYDIARVDHFIELENNTVFQKITNIVFPHDKKNASDAAIKRTLIRYLTSNETLQGLLRRVYRKDTDFFLDNKLECVNWRNYG